MRKVLAEGEVQLRPMDLDRARRKLTRYLGDDESRWDPRFRETLDGTDGARFACLAPERLVARDLSYRTAR